MKKNKILILFLLLLIIIINFCSASVNILDFNANIITTSNNTEQIYYNLSTNEGLSSIKISWDNINYSLYSDSLVLFYNFDNRSALGENDLLVNDLSLYSNNGTVVGGENISWTPNGKYGGAFNFSGMTNYINVASVSGVNRTSVTYSFWVKRIGNSTNSAGHVFNGGGVAFNVYFANSGNQYNIIAKNNSKSIDLSISNAINDNEWNNFILSYDGTNILSYRNSILEKTRNIAGPLNITNNLLIGTQSNSFGPFNGSIDDFIIINKSLSTSEVQQIYYSQLTKYNSQNWSFISNQTLDYSTSILNASSSTKVNNYYLCSSNSSGSENCSTQKTITQTIPASMILANFSTSLWNINNNPYGVNIHSFLSLNGIQVDTDNDGVVDTQSNSTWHKSTFLNTKMGYVRRDVNPIYYYNNYTNGAFNFSHPFNVETDLLDWAYQNNLKIIYVGSKTQPVFLQNTSSSYCNETNYASCPPNNYTLYGQMYVDFITNVTNNGKYNLSIEFECVNEPNLEDSYLNNITVRTNPIIATELNKMCNASFYAIHQKYPNMKLLGISPTFESSGTWNIEDSFMSYFNGTFDGKVDLSFHSYTTADIDSILISNYNNLKINMSNLGVNFPRIVITEFNYHNGTVTNASSEKYWNQERKSFANIYATLLNSEENVTFVPYEWTDSYIYGQYYPEFPYFFNFVQEPSMGLNYYPPYNVTKNFGNYCGGGSTVYQSISDDSTVKVVTCKDGNNYNIIIINTDVNSKNIIINNIPSTVLSLTDSNGNRYKTNLGSVNIGILDSYEIIYLDGIAGQNNYGLSSNPICIDIYDYFLTLASMIGLVVIIIIFGMTYMIFKGISLDFKLLVPLGLVVLSCMIFLAVGTVFFGTICN